MGRGPPFIDREVFESILDEVRRADGTAYQDKRTIYTDMSRLVVAWLAGMSSDEINRIYNELGWRGAANGRAIHEAARVWMRKYRSRDSTTDAGGL